MSAVSRGTDTLTTGHGCDTSTTIDPEGTTGKAKNVFANGLPIATVGNNTVIHNYPSGSSCVPHVEPIISGSSTVYVGSIAIARIGDPVDSGKLTSGSPNVSAG